MGELNYEFAPADSGPILGEPDRDSRVTVDVIMGHGDVHVHAPEATDYGDKCKLTGDTYHAKEAIKATEWDDTHHEWTGDYWRVDAKNINLTIGSLLHDGYIVTADREAVRNCPGLSEWHKEVMPDENTTFRFDYSKTGDVHVVSRSRAEKMAKFANLSGPEELSERWDVTIREDAELMRELGVDDTDERVTIVTSQDGMES